MTREAPHVVVVGGGITGLTAAFRLVGSGLRVSLLEAHSTVGGKVRTGSFAGLDHVFQSHYAACLTVPPGAELLASSEHFEVQAFRIGEHAYGLQFHPDAREDMIPSWYSGNSYLHGRPGVHLLDQQVADAARHERSIHEWCERFMAHWLEPAV